MERDLELRFPRVFVLHDSMTIDHDLFNPGSQCDGPLNFFYLFVEAPCPHDT